MLNDKKKSERSSERVGGLTLSVWIILEGYAAQKEKFSILFYKKTILNIHTTFDILKSKIIQKHLKLFLNLHRFLYFFLLLVYINFLSSFFTLSGIESLSQFFRFSIFVFLLSKQFLVKLMHYIITSWNEYTG